MVEIPNTPEGASVRQLGPAEVAAFATAAATAIAEELRAAVAPGIQLLRPLGAGAMGLVFLGRDPLLKRLVAIKVLSPHLAGDDVARARFVRESEASAAVMHPNVAGIYLVGELPESGTPYYVMQFIDGRSLAEEIASGGATSELRARRMIGEIASALEAAHARGLVHRDVKPANIMIDSESDRPVVLDFGISAVLQHGDGLADAKLTSIGSHVGTPTYMSPEQAAGEPVTGQSDVYGLGVIAFELLSGHPPFDGPPVVVMAAHLEKPPPSLHTVRPGIDAHLAELVDRCLRKQPSERPTAADVAHSLIPGSRSLMEWPPPGMEGIHGQGARLVWRWAATISVALLFFLLLHLRPTLGSPLWAHGEQSMIWNGLTSSSDAVFTDVRTDRPNVVELPSADTASVWIFLISSTVALLLLLAVIVAWHTARLARDARRASRGGYPWPVVFDVAWDRSDDTSSLLNGSGVYALLLPERRKHLLFTRRTFAVVSVVMVMLGALTPTLWMAGVLRTRDNPSTDIVTGYELLMMALPLLAGGLLLAFLDRRARRATATGGRSVSEGSHFHGDLVSSWLRESGRGVLASRSRSRGGLVTVASAVAAIVLLAAAYVALVVFTVVFVSTTRLVADRAQAEQWRASFLVDSTHPVPFTEVDTLARRSGVPAQGSTPDLEAGRLLIARSYPRNRTEPAAATFAMDLAGARALSGSSAEPEGDLPRWAVTIAVDSVLPSAERLKAVERYTQSPWLPVWRRFASSPDYPLMWQYRPSLPGAKYMWQVPTMRSVNLRDLAYRNELAGLIALSHGDVATATLRARENIAAGRHVMRATSAADNLFGLILMSIGRSQLSLIARTTGDRAMAEEASRLRATAARWRSESRKSAAMLAMVADPESREAIRYTKQLESPALFDELMLLSSSGFCFDSRELLFGSDPERLAQLHDIAIASGNPRAGELEELGKRWLSDVNAGTLELAARPNKTFAPLGWIGMHGFRDRARVCLSSGIR
jgi:serine/threonine-protein kinase